MAFDQQGHAHPGLPPHATAAGSEFDLDGFLAGGHPPDMPYPPHPMGGGAAGAGTPAPASHVPDQQQGHPQAYGFPGAGYAGSMAPFDPFLFGGGGGAAPTPSGMLDPALGLPFDFGGQKGPGPGFPSGGPMFMPKAQHDMAPPGHYTPAGYHQLADQGMPVPGWHGHGHGHGQGPGNSHSGHGGHGGHGSMGSGGGSVRPQLDQHMSSSYATHRHGGHGGHGGHGRGHGHGPGVSQHGHYSPGYAGSAATPSPRPDRTYSARTPDRSRQPDSPSRPSPHRKSSPQTIKWLLENYEAVEGVSLPRSSLYTHYLEFCERHGLMPVNPASFGKIIRQQFPHLKTRRLGTRGQSKYHYYGIGLKPGAAGPVEGFKQSVVKYSLPQVPPCSPRLLPVDVDMSKVQKLLRVCREHSVGILHVTSSSRFADVKPLLMQFWRQLPSDFMRMLEHQIVIDMLLMSDDVMFRALNDLLVPDPTAQIKPGKMRSIRLFAKNLTVWVKEAVALCPKPFQTHKTQSSERFCASLKRQTSFCHLAQATKSVLKSEPACVEIERDWSRMDSETIFDTLLATKLLDPSTVRAGIAEFSDILKSPNAFDRCLAWAKRHFDAAAATSSLAQLKRMFLMWTFVSAQIMKSLTIRNYNNFGSFHVIRILLDEYILYLLEHETAKQQAEAIRERVHPPDGDADASNMSPLTSGLDDHHPRYDTLAPSATPGTSSDPNTPGSSPDSTRVPQGPTPSASSATPTTLELQSGVQVSTENVATVLTNGDFAVLPLSEARELPAPPGLPSETR